MNSKSECNYNIQFVSLWFKRFIHVFYPSFNCQYFKHIYFLIKLQYQNINSCNETIKVFHAEMLQAFGIHGIKNFSKTKI